MTMTKVMIIIIETNIVIFMVCFDIAEESTSNNVASKILLFFTSYRLTSNTWLFVFRGK
jgi:hypothetical protein